MQPALPLFHSASTVNVLNMHRTNHLPFNILYINSTPTRNNLFIRLHQRFAMRLLQDVVNNKQMTSRTVKSNHGAPRQLRYPQISGKEDFYNKNYHEPKQFHPGLNSGYPNQPAHLLSTMRLRDHISPESRPSKFACT